MKRLLIALGTALPLSAHAFLMPNITGDQAGTLPQGRLMFAFPTLFGEVGSQYSADRQAVPIQNNLQRPLGWSEMIQADAAQGPQLEGLLRSNGVDPNTSAGRIAGDFSGRFQALVPVAGVGLFDRLGLFVAVPIIRFQAEMGAVYQASPEARALIEKMRANGQDTTADEMADRLNNGFRDRMNELGYQFESSIDRWEIGDIRVVTPITVINDPTWILSLQPTVSIPTGSAPNPDSLIPFSSGTGRWMLGSKAVTQWEFAKNFFLIGSAALHYPLPANLGRRVPRDLNDTLPADVDRQVRHSEGWQTEAQLDLKWQAFRSWSLRTGVQFQHRFATQHQGQAYDTSRYDLLNRSSEMSLQTWNVNVEFFSLRAFLDGDFPFPIQAIAGLAVPISGIGTLSDPLFLVQGTFFF
jgi:hypothetical protein